MNTKAMRQFKLVATTYHLYFDCSSFSDVMVLVGMMLQCSGKVQNGNGYPTGEVPVV